jgi:NADH-quinone oxidoreductase subunit L
MKRVLAYSTISQLGFMVAAVGLTGYAAGMFHLVTHAFFKALLFLGAGSVIHAIEHGMHSGDYAEEEAAPSVDGPDRQDPQDIRNMGGLGSRMRWTSITFAAGWLALSGIFPFAGFWSKDEILVDAWKHNIFVWVLLTVAAFLTAFYMSRLMILVFDGRPRTTAAARAHESGSLMVLPLIALALLSLFGGVINLPDLHSLADFLGYHAVDFELGLAAFATAVAVGGIVSAWALYSRGRIEADAPDRLASLPFNLFVHLNRKWYWDEFYTRVVVRPFYWTANRLAFAVDWNFLHDYLHDSAIVEPFRATAAFLANPIDLGVVDGIVNGLATLIQNGSGELRKTQTGYVRNYALSILLGVIAILAWFIFQ